jgi:hypothetical protein
VDEPEAAQTNPGTLRPPPPPPPIVSLPPPPPPPPASWSVRSAPPAHGDEVAWWRKVLGGLGWLIAFVAIFSTTQLVLRLALEAVGVDTTVAGPTGGDEKNPPGQYVALFAALAVGVLGTLLLWRWYHSAPTDPTPVPPDPGPLADSDAEAAR